MEGAEKINILNRTIEKAFDITEIINNNYNNVAKSYVNDDKQINKIFSESDIIINATPIGMYPEINATPLIKKVKFSKEQIVYDTIYNPTKTKLLIDAERAGAKVINGIGMLFYQGIFAYEIWTGIKITEEVMKDLYTSFNKILNK